MKENNTDSTWPAIYGITGIIICIVLFAFGIHTLNKDMSVANKRNEAKVESDNAYNVKHPEIVGTNANGEVITRTTIRYGQFHYHFIYEVGNTKTTNTPFGKGNLDVIVEKR